jgi:thiol-disulfide isomerase/thioredoxin
VHLKIPVALALLALAGSCRSDRAAPAGETGAEAGLAALAGRTDMNGSRLDVRGDATVVVVFASWCAPCRKELAALGELRQSRPNVKIIGLNAYEEFESFSDEKRLAKFLADRAPWLTVVRDDGELLARFGSVPKIPTVFVYDRAGKIVAEFSRNKRPPPDKEELAAAIDSAVKRS